MAFINANIPDVCIPYLPQQYSDQNIKDVFDGVFGKKSSQCSKRASCVTSIKRVSRINKNSGELFDIVFIRFSKFVSSSDVIREFSERINRNEEVRLLNILGTKSFWKVYKRRLIKPLSEAVVQHPESIVQQMCSRHCISEPTSKIYVPNLVGSRYSWYDSEEE